MGGRCSGTGGLLRLDPAFAYAEASFLMTFAMGGVPHAGSRQVSDFTFLHSKITADGDCSHEIKRCLLLGKKVTTNLDCILKSRDITLLTKVHVVKAMVFPVFVMDVRVGL